MTHVPRLEAGSDLQAFIRAWSTSDALAELVETFGGAPDRALAAPELLAWLDDFSAVWDYRARKERNEAAEPDLDAAAKALVDRLTSELGLRDTAPPARTHYDQIVILGGLTRGCLSRALHAARLLQATVAAGRVTALTAFRPLNAAEQPLLDAFEITGAETEFDVMDFSVRHAFALSAAPSVDSGANWRVHSYERAGAPPVHVAAAPAVRPETRANTAETYEWLAASGRIRRGDTALIVTTYHYRLYQLIDAIRVLGVPHGIELDAVGMVPGEVDERLTWSASPGALLQELRSTIRALRRLVDDTA